MKRKLAAISLAIFILLGTSLFPVSAAEGDTIKIDGNVTMAATDAVPVPSGSGIRHEDGENQNLGYWEKNDTAYWNIEVTKPGIYKVIFNYSKSTDNDADVIVTVGDKTITNTVPTIHTWSPYEDLEMGTIEFTADAKKFEIGGVDVPDTYVMNLKYVTLELVSETATTPQTAASDTAVPTNAPTPASAPKTGDVRVGAMLLCIILSASTLLVLRMKNARGYINYNTKIIYKS